MELKVVTYEVTDGVAVATLNRPDRLNAWTNRMEAELRWCMRTADDESDVRVIVITGAGRGFCAGADMEALAGYVEGEEYDLTPGGKQETTPTDTTGAYSYLLGLSKPVIAAINGPAAGAGFVLACFTDIRFAVAGAKITTSFARLGLPAEHGVSYVLPRIVGVGRAADMLFSSRVILAEEACEMGFVNRVYPAGALMAETMRYARTMANEMAPSSLRAIKAQLWAAGPLVGAWQDANARMVAMLQTEEFAEGVAAFREKRPAKFGETSLRRR